MRKREHMAVQIHFGCRTGWALLATGGIAIALAVGCDAHPLDHQRDIGPSVIALSLPESFDEPDRPIVEFDHASHTAALGSDGCQACHPAGDDGAVSFKFKRQQELTSEAELMEHYHYNCMSCHEQRGSAGQSTGPLTCGDCHVEQDAGRSLRDEMRFDYSLHGRHSQAESDKCESCHHVYNEQKQALEYQKGAESACADCHGERDEGSNPSLGNASHRACVGCHIDRAEKSGKTGPQYCTGCHDAADKQQNVEKLAKIPRIERDQPKTVWIDSEAGEMAAVPFDHIGHEPLTTSCSSCHHQTLGACDECHTLRGSEKGEGVTAENAYHALQSKHSCVGCHAQHTEDKGCAGCHHSLELPPAESACATCHTGKPSAPVMSSPAPEQVAMSEAGSAAPPPEMEVQPAMTPPPASAIPVFEEVQLSPLPAYSDDFPETVTIDAIQSEYKPSVLPHGKIVAALDRQVRQSKLAKRFHEKTEVLCSGCHHQTPTGVRPPACGSCHADAAHPTRDKPALKAAYHLQCIECHQKMSIEAQGCTDCHEKASGEVVK